MPTQRLTPEMISAAIDGFEAQKIRIDGQIAELRGMLNGRSASTAATAGTTEAPTRKRKKFSAAARRKMAMAQKARWAKFKGAPTASSKAEKPKRKLSAAGRKAIIAALKKRWALKRAAAKKA